MERWRWEGSALIAHSGKVWKSDEDRGGFFKIMLIKE